ncbi:imidazolonepropionase [Vibrio metschnikovii]|nr:imidazolonepropionase [Vibrio metschnikovii]EKO3690324.1 imidazolonepropionase [Vibrio metschnikovii]EKO3779982.1 imidazolonepropionase [Vibrio metschnikovii]EKO3888590.1 imidazolonepropionase [Vibrio metschnikovii]EKO3937096.1 imidazolonepropionase [Vibrio metschnikovii]
MEHVLTNARIVSMQADDIGYQPSEPLSIVIRDGKIADITTNTFTDHPQRTNCQGQLVTPGLIDCHTHLIYAGQRANEFEQRLNGVSYQTIAAQGGGIMSTVKATRQASQDQLIELALPRLDGLLRSGITSVEIKSGYGLTLDDEIKMLKAAKALEAHRRVKITTTLLAAHAVPPEFAGKADSYVDFICQSIIPQVAEQQLASSVDVFCESVGFNLKQTEQVFQCAIEHGLAIKGHTEQLSNLGGSALTARYNGLSVDHIEYLDEAGVQALAQSTTVATLLPGAFYFLRETRKPPIEWLRHYQVPMAIATDINPGTSPFADLTLMMNMACTLFGLTPQEALRGVTTHAAQALGVAASRGQIAVGYDADLAFWSLNHPAELSYQVGIPSLQARMVDGELCHD